MSKILIDEATVKDALECLDGVWRGKYNGNAEEVITAIRKALAEQRPQNCGTGFCSCIECPYVQQAQQQEPVAWLFTNVQSGDIEASTDPYDKQGEREYWHPVPLYTSPSASKPWVGLDQHDMDVLFLNEDGVRFARYIEAKLKEKNT